MEDLFYTQESCLYNVSVFVAFAAEGPTPLDPVTTLICHKQRNLVLTGKILSVLHLSQYAQVGVDELSPNKMRSLPEFNYPCLSRQNAFLKNDCITPQRFLRAIGQS